jgi:ribosomal peptide maturation radical SAM protein 1
MNEFVRSRSLQATETHAGRVALVNMPFALADRPSIQCGLLKAGLQAQGRAVDVYHLNLELAVELGARLYHLLSSMRTGHLLGDWLFAEAAFGSQGPADDYRRACPDVEETCRVLGLEFQDLQDLRAVAFPALVKLWARRWNWDAYRVVGFTSTFEQNVPAIAMARAVKDVAPGAVVVMGGANFDGDMGPEYVRAFPWLDYAIVGEADLVFPELVARIASRKSATDLRGVVGREADRFFSNGRAPAVSELDSLPEPDYSEYFATLAALGRSKAIGDAPIQLPFEGARGCWWGQKHPCRFCGLNSTRRGFRAKSAERTVSEIGRMVRRYENPDLEFVDTIVDPRHLAGVQALSGIGQPVSIFCNVPATLTPDDLRSLRGAGVHSIQPGIESLSSRLLRLMNKGTSLLTNLRLLKWASHIGMDVRWNLLTGVPGERRADYAAQLDLLPLISHLPPPQRCGPIWLSRFSPYFEQASEQEHGLRPHSAYRHIYPESSVDTRRIAYFWEWDRQDVLPKAEFTPLRAAVEAWQGAWGRSTPPTLTYFRAGDTVTVIDGRKGDDMQRFPLRGVEAEALLACDDKPRTAAALAATCTAHAMDEVGSALARLCQLGFVVEEAGRFLTLVLPGEEAKDGQRV